MLRRFLRRVVFVRDNSEGGETEAFLRFFWNALYYFIKYIYYYENIKRLSGVLLIFALSTQLFALGEGTQTAPVPNRTMEVWQGVKMPGTTIEPRDYSKAKYIPTRISVKNAVLSFYKADFDSPNGCVIIFSGGGYTALWSLKSEGTDIVDFFLKNGISAAIVEYRVPDNFDGALMDAQRALRLVRANAKEWNVNPEKIAVMGFSAGASLAARVSTNFKKCAYDAIDDIDKISARPDYTVLIYPAYCSQPEKDRRLSPNYKKPSESYDERYAVAEWNVVDADTPPAFITQTQFDPYGDASIAYYLALKKNRIPAELYLLSKGKHGDKDKDVFEILAKWLKERKF